MSYRTKYKKPYEQPPPSPIEISFWEKAKPLIPELQREAWIDKKHRVDFLVPSKKVIIELYGYKYHSTKDKITKDAGRERFLQGQGYRVIRFTGTEVYKDPQKCVDEVLSIARIQPASVPPVNFPQVNTPPEIISAYSNEAVANPPWVGKTSATPEKNTKRVHTYRRKKFLGMEKWQVKILIPMFFATMIILLCLGSYLFNQIKVP
jgi:hypothetical protein